MASTPRTRRETVRLVLLLAAVVAAAVVVLGLTAATTGVDSWATAAVTGAAFLLLALAVRRLWAAYTQGRILSSSVRDVLFSSPSAQQGPPSSTPAPQRPRERRRGDRRKRRPY